MPLPPNTTTAALAEVTPIGGGNYQTEASSIHLAPHQWPETIYLLGLGTEVELRKSIPTFVQGELVSYLYETFGGEYCLRVWND